MVVVIVVLALMLDSVSCLLCVNVVISLGYKGVFVARNIKDYCEGEATFYRTSRFCLESSESLLLSDVIDEVRC